MTVDVPFLARQEPLRAIRECLGRLAAGRLQVIFIEGEAGIGKSRLLDVGLGSSEGITTIRSRGDELEQRRPFGMLADALDCRMSSTDSPRAAIAHMIAEGASEQRLLDSFADLAERLAMDRPLVLGLDDVQWADPSTLLALRYFTRHLCNVPIGLVVAYRPVPENPELEALVAGAESDGARRVMLDPLDPETIVELVSAGMDAEPSAELLAMVARAGGNPFYVLELAESLRDTGPMSFSSTADGGRRPLPSMFQLSIRRYLRFLSPRALELLRLAAVLGSTFSVDDLAAVAKIDVLSALPVLDEGRRAGVLAEAGGHVAFRHDLLREALYADLPLSVRRALHRQVGLTLAAGGGSPVVAAEHLLAADGRIDEETLALLLAAVHYTVNTGARANLLMSILDRLPAFHARRSDVAAQAIWSLTMAGRGPEADDLAERALASGGQAAEAQIRLALLRSFNERGISERAFEQLDLLHSLPGLTPETKTELNGRESFFRFLAGDLEGAVESADRAVDAARCIAAPLGLVLGLQGQGHVALLRGRGRDAVIIAEEAVRHQGSDQTLAAHVGLAEALLGEDRFDELDQACSAGESRSRDSGVVSVLPYYHLGRMFRALAVGAFDDAATEAEVMVDLLGETQGNFIALAQGVLARIALHRGDVAIARSAIDAGGRAMQGPAYGIDWYLYVSALTLEAEGHLEAAYKLLETVWDSFAAFRLYPHLRPGAIDLLRMALPRGEQSRAQQIVEVLATATTGSDAPSVHGGAQLTRGLVEQDPAAIRRAIATYAAGPRVLATAQARELGAEVLDAEESIAELRRAAETYQSVGAGRDVARLAAALRQRGTRLGVRGPRRRPAAGWESLTPSERQVVALAAQGLTTRGVAERLFVSINTVETHLRHVYRKLEIGSRAELATLAARRRLMPGE